MAWTEKHGKRYRGRYIDANNKRHTAGWSTSKREALRMAQVEEMRIRKGTWRDPSLGSMLFSDYFENHWLPHRLRDSVADLLPCEPRPQGRGGDRGGSLQRRVPAVLSPEPWWRSPGCTTCCTRPGTTVLATDAHMSVGAGVTAVRRNLEYVPE